MLLWAVISYAAIQDALSALLALYTSAPGDETTSNPFFPHGTYNRQMLRDESLYASQERSRYLQLVAVLNFTSLIFSLFAIFLRLYSTKAKGLRSTVVIGLQIADVR